MVFICFIAVIAVRQVVFQHNKVHVQLLSVGIGVAQSHSERGRGEPYLVSG